MDENLNIYLGMYKEDYKHIRHSFIKTKEVYWYGNRVMVNNISCINKWLKTTLEILYDLNINVYTGKGLHDKTG